jgi:hypothetical protein
LGIGKAVGPVGWLVDSYFVTGLSLPDRSHTSHVKTVISRMVGGLACASVICPALFLFSACSDPGVGSAPFPLFPRVILTPVFSRAYSGSATLFNPIHQIK